MAPSFSTSSPAIRSVHSAIFFTSKPKGRGTSCSRRRETLGSSKGTGAPVNPGRHGTRSTRSSRPSPAPRPNTYSRCRSGKVQDSPTRRGWSGQATRTSAWRAVGAPPVAEGSMGSEGTVVSSGIGRPEAVAPSQLSSSPLVYPHVVARPLPTSGSHPYDPRGRLSNFVVTALPHGGRLCFTGDL